MRKLIYLGGNKIGADCLEWLIKNGYTISLIIGRYSEDNTDDPVIKLAIKHNIKHISPKNVNSIDVIELVKSINPYMMFSIQYDQILKKEFIETVQEYIVNLHFAPLPKLRGCFPIPWAIIEEDFAGITYHIIDVGIDNGDILIQKKIPIQKNSTAFSLYKKAEKISYELFVENFLELYNKNITPVKQDDNKSSYHPKGYPNDRWINWNDSAFQIDKFIRALTFQPYPSGRTKYNNIEFEILYPVIPEKRINNYNPGTIIEISKSNISIVCGNNTILICNKFRIGQDIILSEGLLEVIRGTVLSSCEFIKLYSCKNKISMPRQA